MVFNLNNAHSFACAMLVINQTGDTTLITSHGIMAIIKQSSSLGYTLWIGSFTTIMDHMQKHALNNAYHVLVVLSMLKLHVGFARNAHTSVKHS